MFSWIINPNKLMLLLEILCYSISLNIWLKYFWIKEPLKKLFFKSRRFWKNSDNRKNIFEKKRALERFFFCIEIEAVLKKFKKIFLKHRSVENFWKIFLNRKTKKKNSVRLRFQRGLNLYLSARTISIVSPEYLNRPKINHSIFVYKKKFKLFSSFTVQRWQTILDLPKVINHERATSLEVNISYSPEKTSDQTNELLSKVPVTFKR